MFFQELWSFDFGPNRCEGWDYFKILHLSLWLKVLKTTFLDLLFFSFFFASVTLQVQLLYELLLSWSSTWARLQRHGILRQTSSIPEPPAGAAPSSPVRSSAGTALPDTSTCSPSADFGSPTEVCSAQLHISFCQWGFCLFVFFPCFLIICVKASLGLDENDESAHLS